MAKAGHGEAARRRVAGRSGGLEAPRREVLTRMTETDVSRRTPADQRQDERRFRTAFESNLLGIIFWEEDGAITDANDAFLRMIGYSRNDLLSGIVRWNDLTPPGYEELDASMIEEAKRGVCPPYEKEFIRKDGTRIPVLLGGTVVAGKEDIKVAFVLDISERKRMEEQLRLVNEELDVRFAERTQQLAATNRELSEEIEERIRIEHSLRENQKRLQDILEHSPTSIYIKDLDGRFLVSNRHSEMTGESIIGQSHYAFLPRNLADAIHADDMRVIREGKAFKFEENIPTRDGDRTYVSVKFPVYDAAGTVYGVCGISTDITERQKMEEDLRRGKAVYSALLDAIPDAIYRVGREGVILDVRAGRRFKFVAPPAELIGRNVLEVLEWQQRATPGIVARFRSDVAEALVNGGPVVREYHFSAGAETIDREVRSVRVDDDEVLCMVRDISEWKRAERALKTSESDLRAMFENTLMAFLLVDPEFRVRAFNKRTSRWVRSALGVELASGMSIDDAFCPADAAVLRRNVRAALDGSPVQAELPVINPDGQLGYYQAHYNALRDADGSLAGATVCAIEITERRRAEEALRKSEERFALAVTGANDGIWDWDLEKGDMYLSARFEEILGYAAGDYPRGVDEWRKQVHPDDYDRVYDAWVKHHDGKTEYLESEYRLLHRDGTYRWVLTRGLSVRDATGKPIRMVGSLSDVTGRRRTEEQARQHLAELAHGARVSTLGEMAAMVAHELNQPLAAIVNYASGSATRLRMGDGQGDALVETMQKISGEALRAGEIIRRIRGFVRKSESRIEPAEVGELVAEAASLVAVDAREHGVRIRVDIPVGLPPLRVDRIQIEQVIVNLLRNAVDAMLGSPPGARDLSVEVAMASARMVRVDVRDTGPGIPPDIAEKIFDRFFTNKPNGLGMGLSISQSIIEAHGGRLWLTTNHGKGTTFHFTVPCGAMTRGD